MNRCKLRMGRLIIVLAGVDFTIKRLGGYAQAERSDIQLANNYL